MHDEKHVQEWLELTDPWLNYLIIISQISRPLILLAAYKWPKVSDYFILSMFVHWTLVAMIPTDKGNDLSDYIVGLFAMANFISIFVDFKLSFVITIIYVAVVLFVIDPNMYQ